MNKGRTLSYWEDPIPEGKKQSALFIKNAIDDPWMLVGIYETYHLRDIIHTTYANWPAGTVFVQPLP
jgi:hypothetical protein